MAGGHLRGTVEIDPVIALGRIHINQISEIQRPQDTADFYRDRKHFSAEGGFLRRRAVSMQLRKRSGIWEN